MEVTAKETEDRLLSTKQAGAATGYHPTHFNAIILDGKLPATKDEKGRWQIKQSDLDKYLSTKSVKPRRSKDFTAQSANSDKSLLTQLDEKEKIIEALNADIDAMAHEIDNIKADTATQLRGLRTTISEGEAKLGRAKNRIEGLKEENADLREENREHTDFLRTTLKELLQYVTK